MTQLVTQLKSLVQGCSQKFFFRGISAFFVRKFWMESEKKLKDSSLGYPLTTSLHWSLLENLFTLKLSRENYHQIKFIHYVNVIKICYYLKHITTSANIYSFWLFQYIIAGRSEFIKNFKCISHAHKRTHKMQILAMHRWILSLILCLLEKRGKWTRKHAFSKHTKREADMERKNIFMHFNFSRILWLMHGK